MEAQEGRHRRGGAGGEAGAGITGGEAQEGRCVMVIVCTSHGL